MFLCDFLNILVEYVCRKLWGKSVQSMCCCVADLLPCCLFKYNHQGVPKLEILKLYTYIIWVFKNVANSGVHSFASLQFFHLAQNLLLEHWLKTLGTLYLRKKYKFYISN